MLLVLLLLLPLLLAYLAIALGAQPIPLGVAVEAALVAALQLRLADAQAGRFVGLHGVDDMVMWITARCVEASGAGWRCGCKA